MIYIFIYYVKKKMYIDPVKKISGVAQTKYIGYYYSRGYNKKLDEVIEKRKKRDIAEIESKENRKETITICNEDIQTIYNVEGLKSRTSKAYNKLNSEDKKESKQEEMKKFKDSLKAERELDKGFKEFNNESEKQMDDTIERDD